MKPARMLILLLFVMITTSTAYAFPQRKTCTCYTGWNCYNNGDGSSNCVSSGFSWYQDASLSCSKVNFISGSYASYSAFSSGAGQSYNTTVVESGSIDSASEINC